MGCIESHAVAKQADPYGLPAAGTPTNSGIAEEAPPIPVPLEGENAEQAPPSSPSRSDASADIRGTLRPPPPDWRDAETDSSVGTGSSDGLVDIVHSLARARFTSPSRQQKPGSRAVRKTLYTPANSPKSMTLEERERHALTQAISKLDHDQQQRLYSFLASRFRSSLVSSNGRVEFRQNRLSLAEIRQVYLFVVALKKRAAGDSPVSLDDGPSSSGLARNLVPLDSLNPTVLQVVQEYLTERFPKCIVQTKLGLAVDPTLLRQPELKEVQQFLLRLHDATRAAI
eukprot:TRINITY_DN40526_c0_g1_i1.p1 TRINITY_DN40526_c0_g1~~TRINITY_DN40526_c0_g1_i1.p1  ORF type:complete len:295 (-),score=42.80 TRINITY_DN40526_c0_g1_i1:77-931(-)